MPEAIDQQPHPTLTAAVISARGAILAAILAAVVGAIFNPSVWTHILGATKKTVAKAYVDMQVHSATEPFDPIPNAEVTLREALNN